MSTQLTQDLRQFAERHDLHGLTRPSLAAIREGRRGYSLDKGHGFLGFQERINRELLNHRIITHNRYTAWFRQGAQNEAQLRAFVVQFSVFSNQFLVAQLQKMINADSLEAMRSSKEILANEIGVVFRREGASAPAASDVDPEIVSPEGTVEGGVFHFRAGHFEWLMKVGAALGLDFNDLGKRRHGSKSTLFFCDELIRLYGSDDYAVSQAASYAVENWAAAGFWDELVEGWVRSNRAHGTDVPIGFFAWHSRLEGQHAAHTQEELEEYYFERKVDEDAFIRHGNEMLDGVAAFWDGLDEQRKALEALH